MEKDRLNIPKNNICISDDVVATIVGVAALETPDISSMSDGLSEGLSKKIGGKNKQKGVSVKVNQLEVVVDLRVVVIYGKPIHEICHQVQLNVYQAIKNMTELNVIEINVKVDGVTFNDE